MFKSVILLLILAMFIISVPAKASSAISTNRETIKHCGLSKKFVWLTFDDGGSAANVNSILKTLKKENVKAVFFPTGKWIKKYPVTTKRIRDAGHILGNHTYSHRSLTSLSENQIKWEIKYGVKGTSDPKLLRPPYGNGAFSGGIQKIAKNMGYQMCFWTVDTRDWDNPSANTIIKRVKFGQPGVTPPVKAGGVVLMHMHPVNTSKALPGVIKAIRGKGLELPPLE